MTTAAIYPGTFDPVTHGHVDIIARAAQLFDRLIIAVADNTSKTPRFSAQQRVALLKESVTASNVEIVVLSGLTVDFAREQGIHVLLRGLRCGGDVDYELQLAAMNQAMFADLETVFLAAKPAYQAISSSLVREIAAMGGDVSSFVPVAVAKALRGE